MVANGGGVSFLVESALIEDLKKKRLRKIPIIDEKIYLEVTIAYLADQPLSPAANAFLKIFVGDTTENRSSQHAVLPKFLFPINLGFIS